MPAAPGNRTPGQSSSGRSSADEVSAAGTGGAGGPRFLTLADVAEILATSVAQVRALVQSGELRYIQIGGRQQYRIETVELEDYIQRMYAKAERSGRQVSPAPASGGAGAPEGS